MKRAIALLVTSLLVLNCIGFAFAATVKATVKVIGSEENNGQEINVTFGCEIGERIEENYCSNDRVWKIQKNDSESCQEDYECKINSCANGECGKAPSFWQKMINWFKNIFSKEKSEE